MFTPSIVILLASAGLIDGRSVLEARRVDSRHLHHLVHKHRAEDLVEARELVGLTERATSDATVTTLAANAIQSGSFVDGSQEIGAAEVGQAKSLTSQNNFINNCAGKTLTNGLQITTGSCNGITMGDIPAKTNMVSSIITFPLAGSASIESDTTFTITVQMANIVAGSFTNADATYYAAPQQLSGGNVIGHTHVTVQDMGATLNPTTALDPTQFAFFKGINDVGNGKGLLSANVTGGLPAGNYRVCTLASASNHQPVLMPVAQRGTADDCTKFTIIGSGTTANAASSDGSAGIAAAAAAASAVAAGPGAIESAASAVASSSASSAEISTTTKAGKGADEATNTTSASKGQKTSVVKQVVVIETLFEFALALGGLCPSVSKNSNQFKVLEELFDDLESAAAAACGLQFTACVSLAGAGFAIEECTTQKDSCGSAASTVTASASAVQVTGTAIVAISQTVTGSVISVQTITTTIPFAATTTQAAAKTTTLTKETQAVAVGQTTAPATLAGATESTCAIVTSTIYVDEPTITAAALIASSCSSLPPTTVTVFPSATAANEAVITSTDVPAASGTASAASTILTSDASALGGIAAPAITNSGDSTRPFLVNGNTFVNEAAAVQRSCDVQFNACANAFNGGTAKGFTIADCQAQEDDCISAGSS